MPVPELDVFGPIRLITYGSENTVFISRQDDLSSIYRLMYTYLFSLRVRL